MKVSKRRGAVLVAVLVGGFALFTAGMALAWGPGRTLFGGQQGGMGSSSGAMGAYGPGGMMGPNDQGGMMGGGMMGGGMMGGGTSVPSGTPVTGITHVSIQNFAYQPASISVKVGTPVTWTNQDSTPHTVTFKNGMKDSGMLRQGQSFSYTFTQAGTYAYYCAYHPNMVAAVMVTT